VPLSNPLATVCVDLVTFPPGPHGDLSWAGGCGSGSAPKQFMSISGLVDEVLHMRIRPAKLVAQAFRVVWGEATYRRHAFACAPHQAAGTIV